MFIADFHIHSKYSRATSKDCAPEWLDLWARRKGIAVIGTGDFTHPAWRSELAEKLVPAAEGLYTLKDDYRIEDPVAGPGFKPHFMVTGEISCIYKKNGKVRKVHHLILLPGLEQAAALGQRLEMVGNLRSDGRPILGLDSRDLLEIVLDLCPEAIFIPAHIWTPHFSLYGAYSGFDDIYECFEDLTGHIDALETGLSSDPPMNWRLSALDRYTLVSNSDAHSPANLGREANIFHTELSYPHMRRALKNRGSGEFHGTIEFFPEEGKYHYDGHRNCKVCWKPAETRAAGGVCPVCGGRITVGVLHRVEALADREEGSVPPAARPFESLVPLLEVIAASTGYTVAGKKVQQAYTDLLRNLGPELHILREAPLGDIEQVAGPYISEGIRRLRSGQVELQPGYDGAYGKVKILDQSDLKMFSGQLCLVNGWDRSGQKAAPSLKQMKTGLAAAAGSTEDPGGTGTASGSGVAGFAAAAPYGLNREQWAAVTADGPATIVVAGPGTGKTRTLVSRIAYLVENCGVPPAQVTAVTFTNKAADEMRLRLESHFRNKRIVKAMTIGTFHAICLQILSAKNGRHSPVIIDEYQALSIIEEILRERNLKLPAREILRKISLQKNIARSPEDQRTTGNKADEIFNLYCSRLEQYGALDYDDILIKTLDLFEQKRVPERVSQSFRYLLVDEFQDINGIQYRLINEWGRNSNNIFIIGDPDQSIYGFRGSDYRYFERFKEDFPGARQFSLVQNYRSTPEIIAPALAVISTGPAGGAPRKLEPKRGSGVAVRLVETADPHAEALFVAGEINRIVGGVDMLKAHNPGSAGRKRAAAAGARGFADMAVLYRTNQQAAVLEQRFLKEGIPYVVAGRDEFLADQTVRRALAFFRYLLNPGDISALLTCLKAANLDRGLLERYLPGERSVEALAALLEGPPSPCEPERHSRFSEMLKKYAGMIHREKPLPVIESWISDHNLSGVRSMELLLHTAVMYEDMASLIQNLVLGRESDIIRSGGRAYAPDAVTLMTLHAAKGLEFAVVFICGVSEGLIPIAQSSSGPELDEERRLFYVGMTRARDELILLTRGEPSSFLAAIPEGLLARESTQKQAPRYRQATLFD